MSCEIVLSATLEGISKFLDHESNDNDNEVDYLKNTLPEFKIALSPTGEVLVFAKKTWLLICGSKWDLSISDGAQIKYNPNWHGHVACKPREEITSVLCLPFLSQGQSYQGCADWTCIVVGFSSGCIRFYTEAMQELGCSILHEEPVTSIKFHCPITSQSKTQKQDGIDIYVLYKSVICILNGSLLSQTLRNKRYQLAKNIPVKNNEVESYTPLDFKKYGFVGQEEVTDACFLGYGVGSSLNTFDHLVTASLIGGFSSNYRPSPPQTSLILTSGRRPFVGFHYTLEGGSSPVLSDVALAVASKIKNSVASTLPDWFGFGSKKPSNAEKPAEIAMEPAEKLSCRFGLCDLWRQGQSVIVSPDGAYCAVADSLGRVLLIDNFTGVAHRMWKGFRDAQCGFLQVHEDVRRIKRSKENPQKPQPRQGLFIVIYAPKKGLIEIFTTQHGRRVTTFKVTKLGRLLYTPRHMGASVSAGGLNLLQNQVVFVSEEGLKEFSIPFHCALEEDNGRLSRDLHVLKKIKTLIKSDNCSSNPKVLEEIEKCAKELKSDEVRMQAIESMITYKNTTLDAFKIVVKIFLESLESKERSEPPQKKIVEFAKAALNLLLFYEFLSNLNQNCSTPETSQNSESLAEELRLAEKELDITLKFISQIKEIEGINKNTTKVGFEEKKSTKLGQYLSCFDFESFLTQLDKSENQEEKKGSPSIRLNLKSSSKEQKYGYLGETFFKGLFAASSDVKTWIRHADSCFLNPKDLAFCLLSFWCNKKVQEDFSSEVCFFVEVLKSICLLNDPNVVCVEYNSESPWWLELRSFISTNPNTINALFAALVCRSITIYMEQERELSFREKKHKTSEGSNSNDTSGCSTDWETLSKDTCQWDMLITQLEDVALLNAILSLSFKTQEKESVFPKVPFDFEYQCLYSIQSNGMGRVSELVAKWMVQFGFLPNVLINKNDVEFQRGNEDREKEKGKGELVEEFDKANEARGNDTNLNLALDYLALLKSRFPYSLSSSSLLCNMCWEYIAYWYKNMDEILYLESAVRYLEAIPANGIKYGMSYLFWTTYLKDKFATLGKMTNRLERITRGKLCTQVIGLESKKIPEFLTFVSEILKIMLHTDVEEKLNFGTNQEVIWQSKSTASASSLVSVALSQPIVYSDLVMDQLQLCYSLLLMSGLNIKQSRIFTTLFESIEDTTLIISQPVSHYHNLKLKYSRTEFLRKALSGAVQTVEEVEYIPPYPIEDTSVSLPTTQLKVDEYKTWLRICFDLAGMWAISLDDLRRHQICELYSYGLDRLAEEVIPSVNETSLLASPLLVIGGKRLKYLIQDSSNLAKKFANLSANLSDWLQTLDIESFRCQCGSLDDIEVIMCYVVKWLPEGHSDQKLALSIIESLASLTPEET